MTREASMPIPITLGAGLRVMREARNLTISEISQVSRVSPRSIQRIEQGRQIPRLNTIRRLAKAFDMTAGELPC